MSDPDIVLYVRHRATHIETIAGRHADVAARMATIGPPLGWQGLSIPKAPPENVEFSGGYMVRYNVKGIKCAVNFLSRHPNYKYQDHASFDDSIRIGFRSTNKKLDYAAILGAEFPKVVAAFDGYKADVGFKYLGMYYEDGGENNPVDSDGYVLQLNEVYNRLRQDNTLDINGRNCIYTLDPAMFWDALLCRRALGYGPEEVIRRLDGRVPLVRPLMDGVYIVFNDDIGLTYAQFVEMNERNKAILGLV